MSTRLQVILEGKVEKQARSAMANAQRHLGFGGHRGGRPGVIAGDQVVRVTPVVRRKQSRRSVCQVVDRQWTQISNA